MAATMCWVVTETPASMKTAAWVSAGVFAAVFLLTLYDSIKKNAIRFVSIGRDGMSLGSRTIYSWNDIKEIGKPNSMPKSGIANETTWAVTVLAGRADKQTLSFSSLQTADRFVEAAREELQRSRTETPARLDLPSENKGWLGDIAKARAAESGYRTAATPVLVRIAEHPAVDPRQRVAATAAAVAAGATHEERRALVRVAESLVDDKTAQAMRAAIGGRYDVAEKELRRRRIKQD